MYRMDFTSTVRKCAALTLFSVFLLLCIFSLMIGSTFHPAAPPAEYLGIDNSAQTAAQRTAFLSALGYSPDAQSEESEQITIPADFGDVYTRYNDLQKRSGGDLTLYKCAACTRYTYTDEQTSHRLNLIVYEDRVIGGDECTLALDGEMTELKRHSQQ